MDSPDTTEIDVAETLKGGVDIVSSIVSDPATIFTGLSSLFKRGAKLGNTSLK